MKAILGNTLVNVEILKQNKLFALVSYTEHTHDNGILLYTNVRTKWIPKYKLIT